MRQFASVSGRAVMVAYVLLLGGCGRLGFDAASDAGLDPPGSDAVPATEFNLAFVTSTGVVPGSLGGLASADAFCQDRAEGASLPGTYVAWLSTTDVDGRDRLSGARGWYRTDGRPFVDRVEDLVAGTVLLPLRVQENGLPLDMQVAVATGTHSDGTAHAERCGDYNSPDLNIQAGDTEQTYGDWSSDEPEPCDKPAPLYCFGTDINKPLSYAPAQGRRAFVSAGRFTLGGGVTAADAQCSDEATAAGLTGGSFRALVGIVGQSAASRFDLEGATWVRLDGIALADSALDFMNGNIVAPLNVDSEMSYVASDAWTGFTSAMEVVSAGRTCEDWTTTGGSAPAGASEHMDDGIFNNGLRDCGDSGTHIYCLEE